MSDVVNADSGENTDASTAATEPVQSQEDKPLGENGEKALKAEREARKGRLVEIQEARTIRYGPSITKLLGLPYSKHAIP